MINFFTYLLEEQSPEAFEELVRIFLDLIVDAVGITHNGITIAVNRQAAEMFGYAPEELIGKSMFDLIAPESREEVKKAVFDNEMRSYRVTVLHKNGSRIVTETHGKPFEFRGKNYRISFLRDITRQVELENQLKQREEQYRLLFENIITPVIITTPEGETKMANPAFLQLSGYTLEELRQHPIDHFYVDSSQRKELMQQLLLKGKVENMELDLKLKYRSVTVLLNSILTTYQGQTLIISSLLDITLRKEMEKTSRQILYGITATSSQEVFDQMVSLLARLLGATMVYAGEVTGHNCVEAVSCWMGGAMKQNFRLSIEGTPCLEVLQGKPVCIPSGVGTLYSMQNVRSLMPSPEGYIGIPLVNAAGTVTGVMAAIFAHPLVNLPYSQAVMQMVAIRASAELERWKTEKQLRFSERLYRQTVEMLPVPFFRLLPQGSIHMPNSALSGFLECSREELEGQSLDAFVHPHYLEGWKMVKDLFTEKVPYYFIEQKFITKGGKEKWGAVSMTLHTEEDGKGNTFSYLNVVIEDITSRRQMEEEIMAHRDHFRSLFNYSPVALWEMDFSVLRNAVAGKKSFTKKDLSGGKCNVVSMNEAAKQLFKIRSVEEMERLIHKNMTGKKEKQIHCGYCHICQGVLQVRPHEQFNATWTDAEGNPLQLSLQYVVNEKENPSFPHVLVTAVDIGAQLNAERQMIKAVTEAEEKERNRIARDLHDQIGAFLAGIKLYMDELLNKDTTPGRKQQLHKQLNQSIHNAIQRVRFLSSQMAPNVLIDYGLIKALEELCKQVKSISHVSCNFTTHVKKLQLPKLYEIIIYRSISELINNTFKHANASEIHLSIMKNRDLITIAYADNGKGFDVDSVMASEKGTGLPYIVQKINMINGSVSFVSRKGKGMKAKILISVKNS